MTDPRFITVEGTEGAGKSTCLAVIERRLRAGGIEPVLTREPGGTPLGEQLRELLLGHRHDDISDSAELLMMFAARAEHLHRVIEPSLASGRWVVCDRFTDATYAYQGYGRGVDLDRVAALEAWVQGDRRPDLTLLLDLPVEVGLTRAGRRSAPDRFESQTRAFFERVRDGYLRLARAEPARFRVIDAARPLEHVSRAIRDALDAFVDNRR